MFMHIEQLKIVFLDSYIWSIYDGYIIFNHHKLDYEFTSFLGMSWVNWDNSYAGLIGLLGIIISNTTTAKEAAHNVPTAIIVIICIILKYHADYDYFLSEWRWTQTLKNVTPKANDRHH